MSKTTKITTEWDETTVDDLRKAVENQPPQLNRPVEVTWEDTQGKGGWRTQEEMQEMLKSAFTIRTIGYLVGDNKERIALTTGISEDGNYMDITTIPRPCVKNIKYLDE